MTKVDDARITGADSLVATIRSYRPGDTVTLTWLRNGEEQCAELVLDSDSRVPLHRGEPLLHLARPLDGDEAHRLVDADHVRVDLGVPGDHLAEVGAGPLQLAQVGDLDRHAQPVAPVLGADQGAPLVGPRGALGVDPEVGVRDDGAVGVEGGGRVELRPCLNARASASRTTAGSGVSGSRSISPVGASVISAEVTSAQPCRSSSGTGPVQDRNV